MKSRGRAIVKSVEDGNSFEALSQLILARRPPVQNRGLVLLSSITSCPAFGLNRPRIPQV